ncbi:MAG TPA: sugar phosphate isomerase/epimerase family protein [Chloroflexota bacterium]|nr:sugar phosphate isomerase/epimerase family protein [Chloroflexota bacterium]
MPRMRLCANTACLAAFGAEEAVRAIAALGYAAVEFLVSATLMPGDAPPARRRALRALCTDLGLAVAGTNGVLPARGYNFLVDDEQERSRGVGQVKRVIDLCADLGGQVVTVGSTGARNIPEGMPRERWLPRALAAYRAWGDYAAPRGVRVTVEIINRYEANWGRTIAEGIAFLAEAGHSNLGLTLDTFHMSIDEGVFAEAIAAGAQHIVHVHTADSNRQAPGAGNLAFAPLLGALRDNGYAGYLSLELFDPWYGIPLQTPPPEALRLGHSTLQKELDLLYAGQQ